LTRLRELRVILPRPSCDLPSPACADYLQTARTLGVFTVERPDERFVLVVPLGVLASMHAV